MSLKISYAPFFIKCFTKSNNIPALLGCFPFCIQSVNIVTVSTLYTIKKMTLLVIYKLFWGASERTRPDLPTRQWPELALKYFVLKVAKENLSPILQTSVRSAGLCGSDFSVFGITAECSARKRYNILKTFLFIMIRLAKRRKRL